MTIERREEYAEVVSSSAADVGPVAVSTSGPARTTAHQTETFTSDPYAVRREGTLRVQKGIYLLFGILGGLLAIRFVVAFAGRQPGLRALRSSSTESRRPFLAPFVGLFGTAAL